MFLHAFLKGMSSGRCQQVVGVRIMCARSAPASPSKSLASFFYSMPGTFLHLSLIIGYQWVQCLANQPRNMAEPHSVAQNNMLSIGILESAPRSIKHQMNNRISSSLLQWPWVPSHMYFLGLCWHKWAPLAILWLNKLFPQHADLAVLMGPHGASVNKGGWCGLCGALPSPWKTSALGKIIIGHWNMGSLLSRFQTDFADKETQVNFVWAHPEVSTSLAQLLHNQGHFFHMKDFLRLWTQLPMLFHNTYISMMGSIFSNISPTAIRLFHANHVMSLGFWTWLRLKV